MKAWEEKEMEQQKGIKLGEEKLSKLIVKADRSQAKVGCD